MERTPAGIRPILFRQPVTGWRNGAGRRLLTSSLRPGPAAASAAGAAASAAGAAAASVGSSGGSSGVASGGSGITGGVSGLASGFGRLIGSGGGVSSSVLRRFDGGFFLLRAAGEGQGGKGGGECKFRVHGRYPNN